MCVFLSIAGGQGLAFGAGSLAAISVDHYPALLPESTNQPDALDASHTPTAFHHITRIGHVNYARLMWYF